jgi:hypothetical protein
MHTHLEHARRLRARRGLIVSMRKVVAWVGRALMVRRVGGWRSLTGNDREQAVRRLQRRDMDRAQWRRWFQANGKYQRRQTAARRAGYRGRTGYSLPRWAVR